MLKNLLKLICFSLLLATTHVMAITPDNLTIQLGNLSQINNLPLHDIQYEMVIPASETYKGDPLVGILSPNSRDISTTFYRPDTNNIEVNLNITDPAIGNRTIWKGKIVFNRGFDKIDAIPEIVDIHYQISINIIQPDKGRPQFIMGIVSV